MHDFEKLGVFYLGRCLDPATGKSTAQPLLYESKHLTTHALCVGMTGSGKTGLGIALVEEAAIDKIPSLIIDPKGDLSNLLLTFPHLSPEEFLPWVDPSEAEKQGMKLKDYAAETAQTWEKGLSDWGEDAARIRNMRKSVEMTIYTPASRAGTPVSILSSFKAPPREILLDTAAVRDRILALVSSLLGLVGINADPIKSREHILLSTIIDRAWAEGRDLDIAALVQEVQKPTFKKVGVIDTDTFYSPKDRIELSIRLNNLLASPGFHAWMEGEPLDMQRLLYNEQGLPKVSIFSIAHLSDGERMFFVTLFLNELIGWMRRQSGTSSLRTLLYMDEIFGFFPPTAMPPSKLPMLTLLKQARAFGLGVVLSTQNPVDLDYKGLANCGTWFIGKLQTERDKARVLEGLKIASNGELNSSSLDELVALTKKRVFLMRTIYEEKPVLFETRWTLSYLRGPLTLSQIADLKGSSEQVEPEEVPGAIASSAASSSKYKPVLPPGITEYYIRAPQIQEGAYYSPRVLGLAKLHFVDTKSKIDVWKEVCLVQEADDEGVDWGRAEDVPIVQGILSTEPVPNSTYDEAPPILCQKQSYSAFEKTFTASLYQSRSIEIYSVKDLGLTSNEGESKSDFIARALLASREKRDSLIAKVREKYAAKLAALSDKMRRAEGKASEQKQQAQIQKAETWISFGATVLGAVLGKGVTKGTISQAGTSMRRAGRMSKESEDAARAEGNYDAYRKQYDELQAQVQMEIEQLTALPSATDIGVETIVIRPRKSDIQVEKIALVWVPSSRRSDSKAPG